MLPVWAAAPCFADFDLHCALQGKECRLQCAPCAGQGHQHTECLLQSVACSKCTLQAVNLPLQAVSLPLQAAFVANMMIWGSVYSLFLGPAHAPVYTP